MCVRLGTGGAVQVSSSKGAFGRLTVCNLSVGAGAHRGLVRGALSGFKVRLSSSVLCIRTAVGSFPLGGRGLIRTVLHVCSVILLSGPGVVDLFGRRTGRCLFSGRLNKGFSVGVANSSKLRRRVSCDLKPAGSQPRVLVRFVGGLSFKSIAGRNFVCSSLGGGEGADGGRIHCVLITGSVSGGVPSGTVATTRTLRVSVRP